MAQHNQLQDDNGRFFYYLKIIGSLALAGGGISFATLLLLLAFVSDNSGAAYWDIVKSGSITRQSLGPSMLLAGLFLASAGAAITWLISLYASSRIAGPLFRLSRNMEILIGSGDATLTPLRKKDLLQEEARQLVRSVNLLQGHYREIGAAADNALALIDSGGRGRGLAQSLTKLRELDRRVQL
ncbi:MAG: hypothetical protein Q7U25_00450 [Sulfuricella sp.]|nr:hypothetical protein [Sulfuricella sp.]